MEATWLAGGEPSTWARDPQTVYRVRIWVPSPEPYTGWMLDDWAVTDAPDVTAVIAWAEAEAARFPGGSCEVLVQATDHGIRGDGVLAEQLYHVRVYGKPADEGTTETVIALTSD